VRCPRRPLPLHSLFFPIFADIERAREQASGGGGGGGVGGARVDVRTLLVGLQRPCEVSAAAASQILNFATLCTGELPPRRASPGADAYATRPAPLCAALPPAPPPHRASPHSRRSKTRATAH